MTAPVETEAAPVAPAETAPAETEHTGGMIALVPANPETFVVAGGDPAEELHTTLAYLGDATEWTDEQRIAMVALGAELAQYLRPIETRILGHAVWNLDGGPSGEFEPATVYELEDSEGRILDLFHHAACRARDVLGSAMMPEQHHPFRAHMTAGYNLDVTKLTATGPVEFVALRVAIGGEVTDYPLNGQGYEDYPVSPYYAAGGRDYWSMAAPKESTPVDKPVEKKPTAPPIHQVPDGAPELPPPPAFINGIPVTFKVLIVEGLETDDGRYIEPGALTHRALPLSILAQSRNPDGGSGHDGADVIGRLDTLERVPGPSVISKETGLPFPEGTFVWRGTGVMGRNTPATEIVVDGYLRGNSADLVAVEAEFDYDEATDTETVRMTSGKIAATTLVPIPAFADGYLTIDGEETAPAVEQPEGLVASPAWRSADLGDDCLLCEASTQPAAVVASAEVAQMFPPAHAFADPVLSGPTALTLDDESIPGFIEVYGHLAEWGTCHTGFADQCVTPPHSAANYGYFNVGAVRVRDVDVVKEVAAGHITMGEGGHAGIKLTAAAAAAHYDNVNTVVADVTAGEDGFGIWVHGVVRRTATASQVEALRASPLSGDWRRMGMGLELIAALAVNTGGFPVRRALVASGAPLALVASGVIRPKGQAAPAPFSVDAVADEVERRQAERLRLAKVYAASMAAMGLDLGARRARALAAIVGQANVDSQLSTKE